MEEDGEAATATATSEATSEARRQSRLYKNSVRNSIIVGNVSRLHMLFVGRYRKRAFFNEQSPALNPNYPRAPLT